MEISQYINCFSGANTKCRDHFILPILYKYKPAIVLLHMGSNDMTSKDTTVVIVDGIVDILVKNARIME